jgi:tetracycline resistance efflux pump
VLTQLPYALISAAISGIGFLIIGFTGSTIISLLVVLILLGAFAFIFGSKPEEQQVYQENLAE